MYSFTAVDTFNKVTELGQVFSPHPEPVFHDYLYTSCKLSIIKQGVFDDWCCKHFTCGLAMQCKAAAERASSWTDRHASQSQVLFDQLRSAQQSLSSMQQGIISHRNRLQAWLQHHEGDEFSLNGEASTSGGPSGASAKRDANRQVHEAEMKARLASHAEASSSNEQISAANEMQPSIDWAVMQLQQTRQLQEEEQEAVSQLQQEMARLRGSSQVRSLYPSTRLRIQHMWKNACRAR